MNRTILLLFFMVLIGINGCTFQSEQKSKKLTHEIDTLKIKVDSATTNSYFIFHTFSQHGVEYMANYNSFKHSIDFFSLSGARWVKSVQLERNGPNQIQNPRSLWVHNWDSLFVHHRNSRVLTIMDSSGGVKKNINLFNPNIHDDLYADHNFPLQIDSQAKIAYLYNVPSGNMPKTLISPMVARFDIGSEKVGLLPVFYSEYYRKNEGKFGNLWNASATLTEGSIIYNFQVESNIYIYDIPAKTNKIVSAPSKFSLNQASTQKVEEDSHPIENTLFFRVLPDPFRKLYYRFHWGGVPAKAEDGSARSMLDKPLFLMVFDQDFNVLEEIKLPPAFYSPFTWFVDRKGLWIGVLPNAKGSSEDVLQMHCFKFTTTK